MDRRLCTLFALALMTTAGCDSGAKTPAHDTFSLVGGIAGENIASLGYDAPSAPIAVPNGFGYGWLRLDGHAGDALDIWVRGSADAVAFLLDGEDNLIAANDDAETGVSDAHLAASLGTDGTYYIAFRDYNYERATFTVSLRGAGVFSCQSDSDCVAVPRAGCCHNGYVDAVNVHQVERYTALRACTDATALCPTIQVHDSRVAVCARAVHQCELVQPGERR
jgi:hypothetical protein